MSRASKGSTLMHDQVSAKEVKVLSRCVSGERPGDSFAKYVEGQATHVHVFGSLEAFISINTWCLLFANYCFTGAIQIQLAQKCPVPLADFPWLLALCYPAHAILPQQHIQA